ERQYLPEAVSDRRGHRAPVHQGRAGARLGRGSPGAAAVGGGLPRDPAGRYRIHLPRPVGTYRPGGRRRPTHGTPGRAVVGGLNRIWEGLHRSLVQRPQVVSTGPFRTNRRRVWYGPWFAPVGVGSCRTNVCR